MSPEHYSILRVPLPPEALESNEFRGSREKFWVRVPGQNNSWLLKFPRHGTGEHWAEKITAEIGNLIGINCARVELARCEELLEFRHTTAQERGVLQTCQNRLATVCESFLPREQSEDSSVDIDLHIFHGCEILEMFIEGYDTNQRFGQREHSVKNVISVMVALMGVRSLNPMPFWDVELKALASYALLDGLVGNTDRHHENWMVAYIVVGQSDVRFEVTPSFDHASSLGRELTDERRARVLETDAMLNYLHRGRGGVFVDRNRKRALSPLRLAKLLCRWRPDYTRDVCTRIAELSNSQIRDTVNRVPPAFMSDIAKEFAYKAIATGRDELLRSAR